MEHPSEHYSFKLSFSDRVRLLLGGGIIVRTRRRGRGEIVVRLGMDVSGTAFKFIRDAILPPRALDRATPVAAG